MGEAMCRNLARRSGCRVLGSDLRREPLDRLADAGVLSAAVEEMNEADLVLLSLPDGKAVQAVIEALQPHLSPGQCVVDTSHFAGRIDPRARRAAGARGIGFADAPVARTREAAERGELSIMVGASAEMFAHVEPVLRTMGTDVTHCGDIGCGQLVKILNNMLVFQNIAALAEAIALAGATAWRPTCCWTRSSKGSGDSFVLRSHGMKSMVPRAFPERAFSTRYAMKDLSYALAMADAAGVAVPGARLAMERLRAAEHAGHGDAYHPVVLDVIDPAMSAFA